MTDQVTKSIIVKGEIGEVFRVWANFTNFPNFMENIESVTPIRSGITHWVMKGPAGTTWEWDAKTTRMEENSRIAWKSVDGNMKTSGQVTFTELPQNETQVTVTLSYVPPGGMLGEAGAALFGKPEERLVKDLRNFKAFVEEAADREPASS